MDSSFVEHVLERARERQKKIDQLKTIEKVPQNKHNKTLNKAKKCIPEISPNSKQPEKKPTHHEKNVDCNTPFNSEGRVQKIIRHNSSTKIISKLPASPQAQLKTLNIQKENFNMEIKLTSSDNVRVEVEIQESDTSDNEETTSEIKDAVAPGLREHAKNKLKKLGRLYAGGEDADISSPIHKTEENFLTEVNMSSNDLLARKNYIKPNSKKGLSKLADLAENIKQREDDTNYVKSNKSDTNKSPLKKWKSAAPQPPKSNEDNLPEVTPPLENNLLRSTTHKKEISSISSLEAKNSNNEKALELDQEILNTLELQGFTRTTSNSRLIYNYNPQTQSDQNGENNPKLYSEKPVSQQKTLQPVMEYKEQVVTNTEGHLVENSDKDKLIISKKFSPNEIKKEENKFTPRSPKKNVQSAIANRTAIFESSPNKLNNDPALMSLAERKALFEKNKGNALIPKAAFAMPVPISNKENKVKINTDNKGTPTKITKWNLKNTSNKEINEKTNTQLNNISNNSKQVNDVNEAGGIASKIAALINNKNTISEEQISNSIKEQKQRDMEVLQNRFNRNKDIKQEIPSESKISSPQTLQVQTPKVPNNNEIKEQHTPDRKSGEKRTKKGDSPQVAAVLEDVKRIKVSQPKDGHLYPSLSDIETANETETEQAKSPSCNNSEEESFCSSDGDANTSFGRDILQAICKKQTPQKRPILEEESTASDVSDILDDMDDYLDEAMGNEDFDNNSGPTPPKLGKVLSKENENNLSKPSNSFHYKNFSPTTNRNVTPHKKSPLKKIPSPHISSEIPTHVVDGDNILPLTHTVSFYRRQQTPVKTPIRQVTRQPLISEDVEQETDSENEIVSKKIQELLDQINKQQMVIAQTSQALNLCNSTLEFMGSTEQVEAEKLLLLATHRRQACLHEVQRLKVEGTLRPQGQHAQNVPLEKGNLVISNIVLPMKKEYVRALAAAGGKGHHVVCLIKCGEQVLSTQLVSTVATSSKNPDHDLYIPGSVKANDIYSDFTVTFEVYCLQAQEEILPHDIKYHINKKGSSKLTPKKTKQESRMILPPKESPAGPQAVRSSSFALMGYVIFSIQSINKTHWTLNKAPSMSPLEGRVDMKISCDMNVSVEYKGFLTMFEDISGFGAWHRRWCMLKGHTLSYWKYPDDEKKKVPIESINLNNSITMEVVPVSRDICARMHTFLIETERDAKSSDKESLTLIRKGDKTVIRHLLSADTKEERIEWCQMFNKALTALKMWGRN